MRTFIIGDIHGRHDKLVACLKLVNFDYDKDRLIQLGDIVDRGTQSYECIEELLKIKNLIAIKGNHDEEWYKGIFFYREDYQNQTEAFSLFYQGARETLQSYTRRGRDPYDHIKFFANQKYYYVDENNNLFVHAGFDPTLAIESNDLSTLIWTRSFWNEAFQAQINGLDFPNPYKNIFIGHTPTPRYGDDGPMLCKNVWNLDTGCGKSPDAKLTIMELETKLCWQA